MSGLTPEDMQDGTQFWGVFPLQFCPYCETGPCSVHSSGGFLTAAMEGTPFSLQSYPPASPISPMGNYGLQAPPSPLDYGYPTTVMPDPFTHTHVDVNPQDILSLTRTANYGNHGPLGTRPAHLQIDTSHGYGLGDDICGAIPSSASTDVSANTDISTTSFIPFYPTSEESRLIQISESGEYKERVGSDAMKFASHKRRKKHGNFKCKYCGDGLTSSHNLKYHVDAHFGIRPYKCPNQGCPFATTAPATAKRHARSCKVGQS